MLLRMLLDVYSLTSDDQTYGLSLEHYFGSSDSTVHKLGEFGSNALWATSLGTYRSAGGEWATKHREDKSSDPWAKFWDRLHLLQSTGSIFFDPWIFDSDAKDAEPIIPVDPSVIYGSVEGDDVSQLTSLMTQTAFEMMEASGRLYEYENHPNALFCVLPVHHTAPMVRQVLRPRIEPDTLGKRRSYAIKKTIIENATAAYLAFGKDFRNGDFSKVMPTTFNREEAIA
jgi:hypothetical protein